MGAVVKGLDALMAAAAVGLTVCTVWLCSADEAQGLRTAPAAGAVLPSIILHDLRSDAVCPLVEADHENPGPHVHVSLNHPDRAKLVSTLAGLCRERRIPPERILLHRQVEAGSTCGSPLLLVRLVADVRRAMMR